MYAARRTTSVASDAKKDVFVSRAMAFEGGGFAGGGLGEAESALRSLESAVGRKGVDSAIFENIKWDVVGIELDFAKAPMNGHQREGRAELNNRRRGKRWKDLCTVWISGKFGEFRWDAILWRRI
jgi:hypothetical protein